MRKTDFSHRLYNGDLTGRLVGINADRWSRPELEEVISAGESLLNVQFSDSFKDDLLKACLDSVYIVQEACYQACIAMEAHYTKDELVQIGEDIDVNSLIRNVVNQQTGRYHSFITQFATGFQDTTLEMYKWLLYPILSSTSEELENGLTYREMREIPSHHHPEKNSLNPGNLTQALQYIASLQVKKDIKPIVLDYDQSNLRLNVVDRGFIIWINRQDRNELLALADLPAFNSDASLVEML